MSVVMPGSVLSRIARVWAGTVYAAMVPVRDEEVPNGAATFLEDLWRAAPLHVWLPSAAAALLIALSPPILLGRCTVFHRLSAADRQRLLEKLMTSRPFSVFTGSPPNVKNFSEPWAAYSPEPDA